MRQRVELFGYGIDVRMLILGQLELLLQGAFHVEGYFATEGWWQVLGAYPCYCMFATNVQYSGWHIAAMATGACYLLYDVYWCVYVFNPNLVNERQ